MPPKQRCAAISTGHGPADTSNCVLYQALDMSHQVMQKGGPAKAPGTDTHMLHGRRVKVQHDYPAAAPLENIEPEARADKITPIQFAMSTEFPFDNKVEIKVSWEETGHTRILGASQWLATGHAYCEIDIPAPQCISCI